ncbi:alpha-ketoacid dehydrogenase subunit beta [Actinoplanes derwentensis]|uniref:Pyruvate dehydrogenase E1 component subunit beta n=1 Tax=Actinoplanes derwentensis TaxID=113562 RepID=A0A1H2DCS1_9ACTN|nr:transketolase C-terminal domain-containing protein [Actinoplanes derwentensis]GID89565.1 pyruvate dehydrogenase [Actinoplanes derwentensis]SDT80533.1 pyruvate dehydrogenase E1 component beta subunit [Actinoplanes derwentensis]
MRIADELNQALHDLLADDERMYLLGEDIVDPYGGAFKITKGLSTRFPDRVLSTPISEAGVVGMAGGLALLDNTVLVEIMFADFLGLAFDQLVNFASKSVTMYGVRRPMRVVVRCATGGGRGYGATHSQSPQKHFFGVPNLTVHELSPVHPHIETLSRAINTGAPALLVEDKTLYSTVAVTEREYASFAKRFLDPGRNLGWLYIEGAGDPDIVIISPGGMVDRCLAAAHRVFAAEELVCAVLVPAQLYPLRLDEALPQLAAAKRLCVVEESTAGGTWGAEVATLLYDRLWGHLTEPVRLVHSADSVIPAAAHLEQEVLVQEHDIVQALKGDIRA